MGKTISSEVLLPLALELYKRVPQTNKMDIKAKNDEEYFENLERCSTNFSNFFHQLKEKLEREE